MYQCHLTHWGRVTHICVSKLTIIGSDNSLSPGRHQAIIWTNAGILLIGPLGANFSEISSETHIFSFKKKHFKMSSGNWQPSCLGLNVLIHVIIGFKHDVLCIVRSEALRGRLETSVHCYTLLASCTDWSLWPLHASNLINYGPP